MDTITLVGVYLMLKEEEEKGNRRRVWSYPWFFERRKYSHVRLIDEYRLCPRNFREYMRMSEQSYILLLNLVTESIARKDTVMRPSISAHDRLAATLRFLATGESLMNLQVTCNISRSALSSILSDTSKAIVEALKGQIKLPDSQDEWKCVAADFRRVVRLS